MPPHPYELEQNLYRAVLVLENEEEVRAFFSDLLTRKELVELSSRLEVARLLRKKVNYNEIVSSTGASTATISRVSKTIADKVGGYQTVLARMEAEGGFSAEEERAVLAALSAEERRSLLRLAALFGKKGGAGTAGAPNP